MYEYGRGGLEKSDKEAVKWYRKAAGQGHANAQYNLGWMYETGRGGLAKKKTLARKWYQKAAVQGNTAAKERLRKLKK
jgi:TPR repeat protein